MIAYSADALLGNGINGPKNQDARKRGFSVYTTSELVGIAGRGKNGEMIQATMEIPLFGLSIFDRIMIAQKCDSVLGVITGRANRIAGLEWNVVREGKEEDRLETKLKNARQIFREFAGQGLKGAVVRGGAVRMAKRILPDLLPDFSNFDGAIIRWRKRINEHHDDQSTEIMDWLHQPNSEDDFQDFIKKWVADLMIHGGDAIYKEYNGDRLDNIYHLPGGSVVPLKQRYVGPQRMFAQILPGVDPKIYFEDELVWSSYMPNSGIGYGMVPLESLVNKVAETLFFDQKAAEGADGTTVPEKIALFGENVPFGDLTGDEAIQVGLPKDEQSRIELLLNEPRKNAVRVLSGVGTPSILDLSRDDTFAARAARQKDIRESVAFVFNMSNMEVNLTGGDDTSGRSTSEAQAKIEKEKGIYPIVKIIENRLNYNILPYRFGSGYIFQVQSETSEREQIELDTLMNSSGSYSVNEIREKRGDEAWGPDYDRPEKNQAGPPDGSQMAPLNMRMQ